MADVSRDVTIRVSDSALLQLLIARLGKYDPDKHIEPRRIDSHILTWQQLGRYRFWLSAYSLDDCTNGAGKKLVVSPKAKSDDPQRCHVYIDVPTINGTDAWYAYAEPSA